MVNGQNSGSNSNRRRSMVKTVEATPIVGGQWSMVKTAEAASFVKTAYTATFNSLIKIKTPP
jgi:hypothetical protein